MSKLVRRSVKFVAYICVVALLLGIGALFIIQTGWFQEEVRQRIVTAVEKASGGRLELGGFSYNWRTLTATFTNFVIHGTEPPSAPPLLRAASIQVQLRILSVFARKVAVSSILVEQPDVYILVRRDGSTNIPTPGLRQESSEGTIQELINLKLRHFELRHGSIRTDLQQIPLNILGDDTAIVLSYDRREPSYLASVTSGHFFLNSGSSQPIAMAVFARGRLERNRLSLEAGDLVSGTSKIHAEGSLREFNHPVIDLQVTTDLAGTDVARIAAYPGAAGRPRPICRHTSPRQHYPIGPDRQDHRSATCVSGRWPNVEGLWLGWASICFHGSPQSF